MPWLPGSGRLPPAARLQPVWLERKHPGESLWRAGGQRQLPPERAAHRQRDDCALCGHRRCAPRVARGLRDAMHMPGEVRGAGAVWCALQAARPEAGLLLKAWIGGGRADIGRQVSAQSVGQPQCSSASFAGNNEVQGAASALLWLSRSSCAAWRGCGGRAPGCFWGPARLATQTRVQL